MLNKSLPEQEPVPECFSDILRSKLSIILRASQGARARMRNSSVPEAEVRIAWDNLALDLIDAVRNKGEYIVKTRYILFVCVALLWDSLLCNSFERTLNLPRNEDQAPHDRVDDLNFHWLATCRADLREAKKSSDGSGDDPTVTVARAVVERAQKIYAHVLRARQSNMAQLKEPRVGRCDSLTTVSITRFFDRLGISKFPRANFVLFSQSLADDDESGPLSGGRPLDLANTCDHAASSRCYSRVVNAPDLDIPLLSTEYKKELSSKVFGVHQGRMYGVACAKFLNVIGIRDLPVFVLTTEGSVGVVSCAYLAKYEETKGEQVRLFAVYIYDSVNNLLVGRLRGFYQDSGT